MARAVVLLSGGMDSATCAALALRDGYEVLALSVDYGQRHSLELDRARLLAQHLGVTEHKVIAFDLSLWGGSSLTTDDPVPQGRNTAQMGEGVPSTYVPARNTVFLSLGLSYAEARDAEAVFIGANAIDYSGYPDCRPLFVESFQRVADVGTRAGVEGNPIQIKAPLLQKTKAEIVRLAMELGVDLSLTLSCYTPAPDGKPCGHCDACQLRKKGFHEAGVADPANR